MAIRSLLTVVSCAAAAAASITSPAAASITSLDLGNYQLTGAYNLAMPGADEASGVAYNGDTGTLFVIDDEGDDVAEFSTTGAYLSKMSLHSFEDVEAITYLGGGQFAITEERFQNVDRVTYTAGGSFSKGSASVVNFGPNVGNVGLEGVSYDPLSGKFIIVKEKVPQAVYEATINFNTASGSKTDLFTPNLGVADLSDVAVLSTVPSFIGTADQDNLLIISQESQLLMEVSRTGDVLSSFDFSGISWTAEGVTIDPSGTIYVVAEADSDHGIGSSRLYVLTPVPEPASIALIVCGSLLMIHRRRDR